MQEPESNLRAPLRLVPHAPFDETFVGARFTLEHRDVFQEVTVRVVEIDGRRGHPREHDWLVGWPPVKVESYDPR